MQNIKFKIIPFSIFYFLVTIVLIGCAGVSPTTLPRLEETVMIEGVRYVPLSSLCQLYNLDYQQDPITHKIILKKADKEAKLLLNSSTALLNNTVCALDKEVKLYQDAVVIPHSFVYRRLAPFFAERYAEEKPIPPSTIGFPIRNIIIDPGHGGKDPGAIGRRGLKEKDVVLDIAWRLKRKLRTQGVNVSLTRNSDNFIALTQRSQVANAQVKDSDFFISIHTNAAHSRWVSGVEVFYLSESGDDDLRAFQAAQNCQLQLDEGFIGKNTEAILWDLIYTDNRKSSIELAEVISRSLSKNLSQKNRGAKPARFHVLKGTNIPAILVEVGFISNAREEKRLRDSLYLDKIASAISEGISEYNRNFTKTRYTRY